jgi:hypothetical protein
VRRRNIREREKEHRMKVIIAGSRGITDNRILEDAINHFLRTTRITEVVSGTARGVDQMGERWAKRLNVPVTQFPAQWDKHGKSAGYRRNVEMAQYADALIAVWDGESKGTKHMIDIAHEHQLEVLIWRKK